MRIDEYDWKRLPPDLVEWITDVTELLNAGKYAMRYYGSTPPTATTPGQQGEFMVAKDGASWYIYVYTDSTDTWRKAELVAL